MNKKVKTARRKNDDLLLREHNEIENRHDEARAVVDKINKERDEMVADFIQIRMERNLKRIELIGVDRDWQRKRTLEEIERYT